MTAITALIESRRSGRFAAGMPKSKFFQSDQKSGKASGALFSTMKLKQKAER
jgi:hypothetical protein